MMGAAPLVTTHGHECAVQQTGLDDREVPSSPILWCLLRRQPGTRLLPRESFL